MQKHQMPKVQSATVTGDILFSVIVPKNKMVAPRFHVVKGNYFVGKAIPDGYEPEIRIVKFDVFNPWDMLVYRTIRTAIRKGNVKTMANMMRELKGWCE